jgi:hypothetical protein
VRARLAFPTRLALAAALALVVLAIVAVVSCGGTKAPPTAGRPCEIFPRPPASLSPHAPSLDTQAAWNQDITRAPRAPDSARVIEYIDNHGDDHLHPDFGSKYAYGFPFKVVGEHQGLIPVHYDAYGTESSAGPFPIPGDTRVEGGAHSDGDRHVIVVDRAICTLFELYGAYFKPGRNPHWVAMSGVEWNLRSDELRPDGWTSADAAGLPIFPGLVGYEETVRGHLHHAIRVTMESTRDAWIHPAVHCAGDTHDRAAPAMGQRLRLKRSYPLTGLDGAARTIAVALKHYGMIVADNGANWSMSGTSDGRWNEENLDQLKTIPGSAFEVVKSAAHAHVC